MATIRERVIETVYSLEMASMRATKSSKKSAYLRTLRLYLKSRKQWKRRTYSTSKQLRDGARFWNGWLGGAQVHIPTPFFERLPTNDWLSVRKSRKLTNTYQVVRNAMQKVHGDD